MDILTTFKDIASDDRMIRDIREAVINQTLGMKADDIFTIVGGIKGGQQVVALREQEYVTKQQEGCEPNFDGFPLDGISQKWDPRRMDVRIKMCYTDFEGSFMQWGLANGYDRYNIGLSEFVEFLKDTLGKAMERDLMRVAIFGDEDLVTGDMGDSPVGAPADYNQIESGLLKTLETLSTNPAFADHFINISENEGATFAEQELDGEKAAVNYYDDLVEVIDFEGLGDQMLTSHTLYKNYKNWFRQCCEGQSTVMDRFEPTFDGRPLKDLQFAYDKYIKQDFKGATNFVLPPHLAVVSDKQNLQIGVDDKAALTDLRLEYVGGADEHFYIKASYLADFKIPNPYAVAAAL